ncbi:hypothetical protein DFH09DRAFT_1493210 [Mycena vulgaris]|nr:hypothetical protein DFH09DRAFT_1493210 [Mycena vulgaris]
MIVLTRAHGPAHATTIHIGNAGVIPLTEILATTVVPTASTRLIMSASVQGSAPDWKDTLASLPLPGLVVQTPTPQFQAREQQRRQDAIARQSTQISSVILPIHSTDPDLVGHGTMCSSTRLRKCITSSYGYSLGVLSPGRLFAGYAARIVATRLRHVLKGKRTSSVANNDTRTYSAGEIAGKLLKLPWRAHRRAPSPTASRTRPSLVPLRRPLWPPPFSSLPLARSSTTRWPRPIAPCRPVSTVRPTSGYLPPARSQRALSTPPTNLLCRKAASARARAPPANTSIIITRTALRTWPMGVPDASGIYPTTTRASPFVEDLVALTTIFALAPNFHEDRALHIHSTDSAVELFSIPGYFRHIVQLGEYNVDYVPMGQYPFDVEHLDHCSIAAWFVLHGITPNDGDFHILEHYAQSARRECEDRRSTAPLGEYTTGFPLNVEEMNQLPDNRFIHGRHLNFGTLRDGLESEVSPRPYVAPAPDDSIDSDMKDVDSDIVQGQNGDDSLSY